MLGSLRHPGSAGEWAGGWKNSDALSHTTGSWQAIGQSDKVDGATYLSPSNSLTLASPHGDHNKKVKQKVHLLFKYACGMFSTAPLAKASPKAKLRVTVGT